MLPVDSIKTRWKKKKSLYLVQTWHSCFALSLRCWRGEVAAFQSSSASNEMFKYRIGGWKQHCVIRKMIRLTSLRAVCFVIGHIVYKIGFTFKWSNNRFTCFSQTTATGSLLPDCKIEQNIFASPHFPCLLGIFLGSPLATVPPAWTGALEDDDMSKYLSSLTF